MSIYDAETAATPDYEEANKANQHKRSRMWAESGNMTPEEKAAAEQYNQEHWQPGIGGYAARNADYLKAFGSPNQVDAARQGAYNTYTPGGSLMFEGSGLFNPASALYGGSGAAAEQAYGDIEQATGEARNLANASGIYNTGRYADSLAYGQDATGGANTLLGRATSELTGLPSSGAANALAIRGVAGPGTEGLQVQQREANALGAFNPYSNTAAQALDEQTRNNAAAMHSLALSGRGGGVNASAQSRGNALAGAALAGEGLQQQQLAAQQYQSNQALALQALQAQQALGASQQSGALGNAQISQQRQGLAAQSAMAGAQNQYNAAAAGNQYTMQQAANWNDLAKSQQGLAGTMADNQQTLGQMNANYLGQAQEMHNQQLSTEAQLRVGGLTNAAQTKAGVINSNVQLNTQKDIANQAADTAMMGSMLSTGAGAVGALTEDDK